jgi:hypothetical protein
MSSQAAFVAKITEIMNLGAKEGSLSVSAAYIEGEGERILISAGQKGLAMDPKTALWLADLWGSPEGLASGLGPLVGDLREAAEMAIAKGAELRSKMT